MHILYIFLYFSNYISNYIFQFNCSIGLILLYIFYIFILILHIVYVSKFNYLCKKILHIIIFDNAVLNINRKQSRAYNVYVYLSLYEQFFRCLNSRWRRRRRSGSRSRANRSGKITRAYAHMCADAPCVRRACAQPAALA